MFNCEHLNAAASNMKTNENIIITIFLLLSQKTHSHSLNSAVLKLPPVKINFLHKLSQQCHFLIFILIHRQPTFIRKKTAFLECKY